MTLRKITIGKKEIIIFICCTLGMVIRFLKCVTDPVQPRDAYTYELNILDWEKLNVLEKNYSPLGLWILSLPSKIINCDTMKGGLAVNLVLGTLIIMVLINIIWLLFRRTDLVLACGLIAATHPFLIRFSSSFLRENTYLFFSVLAILYSVKYIREHTVKNTVLIAIFSSFAFLCRLEALEYLFLFFVFMIYLCMNKKVSVHRAVIHYALFIVFFSTTLITCCWCLDYKPYKIHRIETKFDFDEIDMNNID